MKQTIALLMALGVLIGGLAGCRKEQPPTEPKEDVVLSGKELLSFRLDGVFTLEEISDILGITVTACNSFESDTSVSYQTEDGQPVAIISLMETAEDSFDETLASYGDEAEATPNLGERAYWSSSGELLVYDDGYAVSINLTGSSLKESNMLSASRQICALLLERLPA